MTAPRPRPDRVLIVQRPLPHYRLPLYDLLYDSLKARGVDLRLVHSARHDARHDDWTRARPWVHYVPVRRVQLGGRLLTHHPVVAAARRADVVVLQHAAKRIENYLLLASPRPRVVLWGHGGATASRTSAIGEAARRWMARRTVGYLAYTDGSASRARDHGVPAERITVVRNSTDTRALRAAVERCTDADLRAFRRAEGLDDGPIGLFVGTVKPRKHLAHVIAGVEIARQATEGLQLVIVGRGSEVHRDAAATRPWLHLRPETTGDDLARWLALTDLVLVPAWLGLAVNDAMAAGRPVLASSDFDHPPEIEYIEHGVNGLVVNDARDPARYAGAITTTLGDPDLLHHLRAGAHRSGEELSIEAMAERFERGVLKALER